MDCVDQIEENRDRKWR